MGVARPLSRTNARNLERFLPEVEMTSAFLCVLGERTNMRIYPTVVTPECFYRGSSPNIPPGFPLKACGNDGLREGASSTQ
jgi:hypothetical protein